MRFSVHLPTCTEGLVNPVPFAEAPDFVRIARRAEQLGYDGVWGNDHITPPVYVRDRGVFGLEVEELYQISVHRDRHPCVDVSRAPRACGPRSPL